MKPLYISRGVYMMQRKSAGATPPDAASDSGWRDDPEGRTLLIADINEDDGNLLMDNGDMLGLTQGHAALDIIRERLGLPEPEDLPDILAIARGMQADGCLICAYCDRGPGLCGGCKIQEEGLDIHA